MKREQIFSVFFLVFLIFILYHLFKIFAPFLMTGFWAFIVVFAFFPIYEGLQKFLKNNRTIASLIMTLIMFAVFVVPVSFLILYLSREALNLYVAMRELVTTGAWQDFLTKLQESRLALWLETRAPQWSYLWGEGLTDFLLNATKVVGNFIATNLASFTKNLLLFSLHFLLFLYFVFLFFRNGRGIFQYFYELIPMNQNNKKSVVATLDNTFIAIIRGQFLTSLIQAIIAGIIFWLLGIPTFVYLGLLVFVASMIPVLGAASVWAPVAIYLLMTGQMSQGIILMIAGFFGISLIDNLLKPIFIGGRAKMSVFLIFLGILGGIHAYGIEGIFLGPVILAIFFALIKIFQQQYIE